MGPVSHPTPGGIDSSFSGTLNVCAVFKMDEIVGKKFLGRRKCMMFVWSLKRFGILCFLRVNRLNLATLTGNFSNLATQAESVFGLIARDGRRAARAAREAELLPVTFSFFRFFFFVIFLASPSFYFYFPFPYFYDPLVHIVTY